VAKAKKKSKPAGRKAAKKKASPVPKGYGTVTPHMVLDDCAKAIEFYKTAFGAKEVLRMEGPGGKIAHAEIQVGGSRVMMSDEMPAMPGQPGIYKAPKNAGLSTGALFLYVKDTNAVFDRAVKAGCTVRQAPVDMFWGDRYSQVVDPFGHTWGIGTRLENLTPKQIKARQQEFFAKMQPGGGGQ
jgi:PhnB protein